MHLLLGHSEDPCCAGVFARLEARGLPVRIVAAPLAPPAQLTWRLDADGLASSLYPDAPDTAIAGVLVRDTGWLDTDGWDAADHAYMQAELRAVTLAWLAGLALPGHQPSRRRALVPRAALHSSPGARSSAAPACRCLRSSSPVTRRRPSPSAAASPRTASPAPSMSR